MSRGLETLARLARWRLEEARRGHADLERQLAELEDARALLLGHLDAERAGAGAGAERMNIQPYFRWTLARGEDLAASIEGARARVETSREAMTTAFRELKTMELAAERARVEAEAARARALQAELDEIALDRHRREASVLLDARATRIG